MKRLLILTTLTVVAVSATATSAFAGGAFGLFYNPLYCDKRCGAFNIHKNAFTQVPNCCPGPCNVPGCNPNGRGGLGPCGFDGPQSFGCGGFTVRAPFSKLWTRCQGGGCSVGGGEHVGGSWEGAPIYGGDHHAPVAAPVGPGCQANGTCAPGAGKPTVPMWTANGNGQQLPAQPVSYQNWGGYNYGYAYPTAMPMYNPYLWQAYGYPTGQ